MDVSSKIRIVWLAAQILIGGFVLIYAPVMLYRQYQSIFYSILLGIGIILALVLGTLWGLKQKEKS